MTWNNTNAQAQKRPSKPNLALKSLEVFIGEWDMEVSRASFLPNPSATVDGYATIEWLDKGAFLVIRQGEKHHPPFSTWIIGRDESTEIYKMLYFDSRGVSRIYDMSFHNGVWKIWRNNSGFSQHFTGKFSKDRKTISAQWEKSSDGKTWEHDFDLTYTRVK
ncbi:hypothetical protein ANME2D_02241 [Candidatus Methanoperedens nitroreducens]|uniref:DUF1579 domain-containing protein n=1 Tax=Candidatus Methanoperedens nitratireducens TaxID=1392998 RepID=A0A062V818_9EURY|nr:hypothetical protein [Candidatus Methanoperedens nitroreducens]KCZ71510.1 hypothetical protein ANME2D_02241 [Candidatus Methanoperedens nitroreducens]MDJ1421138.1 hypothetical protein [Candidatus Methanoperedens sp.]